MVITNNRQEMKDLHYTDERNVQIVIALLKAHGIHRVIASPGTTNMTFVVSIQNDPWFQVWSSVDERSAAYLACGMADETGEPVVISCTGATASRNYLPGLTEAYYRKLPVLAITSTRGVPQIGHLHDQQIDRRSHPNDTVMESVYIPMIKDAQDEQYATIEANKAILALKTNGGGPCHIDMCTSYSKNFSIKELPPARVIKRYYQNDVIWPIIPNSAKVAIFVGAHQNFSKKLSDSVDLFCATYDSAVFCDHTSGYRGKYEVNYQIVSCQESWKSDNNDFDLCIHIGEVSGDQYKIATRNVWRGSPDGALRDSWGKLSNVFMMPEEEFFIHYAQENTCRDSLVSKVNEEVNQFRKEIPELPLCNIWMAQQLSNIIPDNCELHLGIYNSLRSWNFFKLPDGVIAKCNVGGFGIDGGISTMMGAALSHPDKLYFGVFGDLAFFYDMNVLGNRHVANNVRILLINNGKGQEFRNYTHPCYFLGDFADEYIAAAGHYGNKSSVLVKHYAEDLGYEYMSASTKEEFINHIERFVTPTLTECPMLLEVFTETKDESDALELIVNIRQNSKQKALDNIKMSLRNAFGGKRVEALKTLIKG